MATTTIRIPDDQYNEIQELANFHGMKVSDFMRDTLLERVEDENDYTAAIEVLNQHNESVPLEDVMREVFTEDEV
ncbi:hypothetical protein IV73_GL000175 [Weissella kandleri]|uniref:Ribbon-helix-helix protein CopG domain-containing protein n=1 Tax=Weissella kandleri TaxID=1616 RepID=A0A0R2JEE5_9LACO|nr:DUF6290 family protein [Weissella kandleri]KRN75681.1 hypothetical protein IV73_GL000175 [Weissella kandleri]